MSDKKKTQQWVTVAAIVGIGLLLVYLWNKKKGDKEVNYAPLDEAPQAEYLTYNQPPLIPEVGNLIIPPQAPINLGDVNVTVGGGGSSGGGGWSPCKSGIQFVVPPINTGITTPTLTPPDNTYTPTEHEVLDVGRYIADCSIQRISTELDEISKWIGVSVQEIYDRNLYLQTVPTSRLPAGKTDSYYDPYNDRGTTDKDAIYGKEKIRYTAAMACECKRGRKQFCGRYLTPDMFKDVYVKK